MHGMSVLEELVHGIGVHRMPVHGLRVLQE